MKNINFKTLQIIYIILFGALKLSAQLQPVDVADLTLKVDGLAEKTLYYGFAEGDQIVFNFSEVDNKELKQIEIIEYPSNSKYMDYESKKIENKTIFVNKKGIYVFRFSNSALGGRVCNIKIQRIPAKEETKNFNTNVVMKTFYDTTWVNKTKNVLVKVDTVAEVFMEKTAVVHVASNEHGAIENVEIPLPPNTAHWAYWIGVGEESSKSFSEASDKLAESAISYAGSINPLAALALGGVSYLVKVNAVDNVTYKFIAYYGEGESKTSNVFYDGGDITNTDYGIMRPPQAPNGGVFFINLYNDNSFDPIYVNIKLLAIKYVPLQKTIEYREPISVSSQQIPVIAD